MINKHFICLNCGWDGSPTELVKKIDGDVPTAIYCPNCGGDTFDIEDGAEKCPHCGKWSERRPRYRPDVALVEEGDKDIIFSLSAVERRDALVRYAILKEGIE